jgi:hypothetical protein
VLLTKATLAPLASIISKAITATTLTRSELKLISQEIKQMT